MTTCQRCDTTENIEHHHWAPIGIFTDPDAWGTITLCRRCHREWHTTMNAWAHTQPYTERTDTGLSTVGAWSDINDWDERCPSVKVKTHRRRTNTDRPRTSSWQCVHLAGHDGLHEARPSARQKPWYDDEP